MDNPTEENDSHFLSQVLEHMYSDLCCAGDCDTFEDYCDNFGSQIDSIKDRAEYEKIKIHMDALVRVTEGTEFAEALYYYFHEEDELEVGLALKPDQSFTNPDTIAELSSINTKIFKLQEQLEEPDWRADCQRYVDEGRK